MLTKLSKKYQRVTQLRDIAKIVIGVVMWMAVFHYSIEWMDSLFISLSLLIGGLVYFATSCYLGGATDTKQNFLHLALASAVEELKQQKKTKRK